MTFFEQLGVPLKVERGCRVFPVSDRAGDIVEALERRMCDLGVDVERKRVTALHIENGSIAGVICSNEILAASSVVIATGGISYPATGTRGDGYKLAESAGHSIIRPRGSLVGVELYEVDDCLAMQGLSLRNVMLALRNSAGKIKYQELGELLFAHYGASGPLMLTASAYIKCDEKYRISIDIKPGLTTKQLDARLQRDFDAAPRKALKTILTQSMPAACVPVILSRIGVDGTVVCADTSRESRQKLVDCMKSFEFNVTSLRPTREAIVTAGGISTKEIDPKAMASKLVGGLYFAGEVIDTDALTGGYNLQIAWSTGWVAGDNAS